MWRRCSPPAAERNASWSQCSHHISAHAALNETHYTCKPGRLTQHYQHSQMVAPHLATACVGRAHENVTEHQTHAHGPQISCTVHWQDLATHPSAMHACKRYKPGAGPRANTRTCETRASSMHQIAMANQALLTSQGLKSDHAAMSGHIS